MALQIKVALESFLNLLGKLQCTDIDDQSGDQGNGDEGEDYAEDAQSQPQRVRTLFDQGRTEAQEHEDNIRTDNDRHQVSEEEEEAAQGHGELESADPVADDAQGGDNCRSDGDAGGGKEIVFAGTEGNGADRTGEDGDQQIIDIGPGAGEDFRRRLLEGREDGEEGGDQHRHQHAEGDDPGCLAGENQMPHGK